MADVLINNHAPEIKSEVERAMDKALEMCGIKGEGIAKLNLERAPRRIDTGRLRNSITHATDGEAEYIGTNVEYAPYVHEGTQRMAANRFLRDAVAGHESDYKAIFESVLNGGG